MSIVFVPAGTKITQVEKRFNHTFIYYAGAPPHSESEDGDDLKFKKYDEEPRKSREFSIEYKENSFDALRAWENGMFIMKYKGEIPDIASMIRVREIL